MSALTAVLTSSFGLSSLNVHPSSGVCLMGMMCWVSLSLDFILSSRNSSDILMSISMGNISFLFTAVIFPWLSLTMTLFFPFISTPMWSMFFGKNAFDVWSLTTTAQFGLICFGLNFLLLLLSTAISHCSGLG